MRRPYSSYNKYFYIPFFVWIVLGGIALAKYDKEVLFRFFNTHHSAFGDVVMSAFTAMGEAWFIAIVLLLLLGYNAFRNWWYFTLTLAGTLLPTLLTQLLKSYFSTPRPLKYFDNATWIHTLPQLPRLMERSFPSGHSCGAFSFYCLIAVLLIPRYKVFGLLFFFLALGVGYSRIYLAAHFFEDVYVGSILGVAIATIVLSVMRYFQHIFIKADKQ